MINIECTRLTINFSRHLHCQQNLFVEFHILHQFYRPSIVNRNIPKEHIVRNSYFKIINLKIILLGMRSRDMVRGCCCCLIFSVIQQTKKFSKLNRISHALILKVLNFIKRDNIFNIFLQLYKKRKLRYKPLWFSKTRSPLAVF